MSAKKIVCCATQFTLYELAEDIDVTTYVNAESQTMPPYMIFEMLVMSGKAKRVGIIGHSVRDDDDDDDEPKAHSGGLWAPGSDDDDDG